MRTTMQSAMQMFRAKAVRLSPVAHAFECMREFRTPSPFWTSLESMAFLALSQMRAIWIVEQAYGRTMVALSQIPRRKVILLLVTVIEIGQQMIYIESCGLTYQMECR